MIVYPVARCRREPFPPVSNDLVGRYGSGRGLWIGAAESFGAYSGDRHLLDDGHHRGH